MGKVVLALILLGFLGWADTLVLTDGTVWEGRLMGATAEDLSFSSEVGTIRVPLEKVHRILLDFGADPKPRMEEKAWSRALGQLQREFFNCRYFRHGLVLAGLALIGFGQWLNFLGYDIFGNMITTLGGIGILWGLTMPKPGCEVPAARLRTLLWIGLEHGWLY